MGIQDRDWHREHHRSLRQAARPVQGTVPTPRAITVLAMLVVVLAAGCALVAAAMAVRFMVDTGASVTSIPQALARRVGITSVRATPLLDGRRRSQRLHRARHDARGRGAATGERASRRHAAHAGHGPAGHGRAFTPAHRATRPGDAAGAGRRAMKTIRVLAVINRRVQATKAFGRRKACPSSWPVAFLESQVLSPHRRPARSRAAGQDRP